MREKDINQVEISFVFIYLCYRSYLALSIALNTILEPESVSIEKDGKFAYITFQEDNAISKLDINAEKFI